MAFTDLTRFNPYAGESDASWRRHNQRQQSLQGALSALRSSLDASARRRDAINAQNQAFRDREYALINTATDQLVQPQSNSKITDVQLQQTGQRMKQEYYDAVKAYQESDKGDEARQEFEQAKQKALTSARTISGALDKLSAQTEAFRQAYNAGGISTAVNPAVREFMADLIDPQTDPNKYQIITDPETQQLKYIDTETGGEKVNFFLDDIANGENQFSPLTKIDMPKQIMDLMTGVANTKKQVENEFGIAEVTDWKAIGTAIDGRLDKLLEDENRFRVIAAEEGFGWDAFELVKNGQPFIDVDGNEYENIDDIKAAVKQDILDNIEEITPHQENQIWTKPEFRQPTLADKAVREENIQKQQELNNSIGVAAKNRDVDFFRTQLLGKVPGVEEIAINKDGKLIMGKVNASGKVDPTQIFDLNKTGDLFRLTELFGGNRSLGGDAERANSFKSQL